MKKITLENGKIIEISDEKYNDLLDGIREKRWVPKREENYFFVDTYADVCSSFSTSNRGDKHLLNTGNCFPTSTEAQAHADKLKAIAKVTEYIWENDLTSDYESRVYYLFYYSRDEEEVSFHRNVWSYKEYSPIPYIKDEKSAEQVLENCKEELLKIYK
jgi:hypothetical protein